MVVAALALTIAVPLRTYLEQRSEAASLEDRQQELRRQVQELSDRKDQLADPAQVQAEARSRLRYVMPGETPYVVEVPDGGKGSTQPDNKPKSTEPWFQELWKSVTK
jgi:cell division protein FtsB